MKIEWLTANATAVGSPARIENGLFLGDFGHFWPVQATIVAGEPLFDLEIPS